MSTDELMGITDVANDDEEIDLSCIVLSSDQSVVHAVITVGSILSIGGRDISASLDELTLVNYKLNIKANENDIEVMKTYGSNDFVKLESNAALDTAIHA